MIEQRLRVSKGDYQTTIIVYIDAFTKKPLEKCLNENVLNFQIRFEPIEMMCFVWPYI